MRQRWFLLTSLALLSITAVASDDGGRERLVGSWVSQDEAGKSAISSWTLEKKGDSLQITELQGGTTVATYLCKADGKECEIKSAGKAVKLSMWFNGPRLVQLETQGSNVVKRRFGVVPQGDTMELEIIPIVPSGKTETFEFKRASSAVPSK